MNANLSKEFVDEMKMIEPFGFVQRGSLQEMAMNCHYPNKSGF